jgi:hypothetical protein
LRLTQSDSPTDVVRAAVAALEAERWGDVLSLVRPEAVQAFRDSYLPMLVASETRQPRTTEEVQAEQPWIPREVAAYHAEEEHAAHTRGMPQMRQEWGVSSFSELEPLSPAEFFGRYLAASSFPARMRAAIAVSPRPPRDAGDYVAAAQAARRRWIVLGEVREGTRRAHVLFRELHGGEPYDPDMAEGYIQVTTLDLIDGRWWLRIDHTLLAQQGWAYTVGIDDEQATPDGRAGDQD